MARENRRIALTKRLLKEALLRLLKKKELKQITITELCEEADINRITFYRHYETPRDVLEDVGRDMFRDLQDTLAPPTSLQDFERYIEDMCMFLYTRSELILLLLKCSNSMDAYAFVQEMYRFLIDEYSNLPELKEYDSDDIRLMTTYFGGGGYFLLRQWLTEDIRKTPHEIASLVYSLTFNCGEIADKTRKVLEGGIQAKNKSNQSGRNQ